MLPMAPAETEYNPSFFFLLFNGNLIRTYFLFSFLSLFSLSLFLSYCYLFLDLFVYLHILA